MPRCRFQRRFIPIEIQEPVRVRFSWGNLNAKLAFFCQQSGVCSNDYGIEIVDAGLEMEEAGKNSPGSGADKKRSEHYSGGQLISSRTPCPVPSPRNLIAPMSCLRLRHFKVSCNRRFWQMRGFGISGSSIREGQPSSSKAFKTCSWLSAGQGNRLTMTFPILSSLRSRSQQGLGYGEPSIAAAGLARLEFLRDGLLSFIG